MSENADVEGRTKVWAGFPYSKEKFAPRGEAECLDAALEVLGCTLDQDNAERTATIGEIDELATGLNYTMALERSAPRLKEVLGQLQELGEATERLDEAWNATDGMTEYALNIGLFSYCEEKGISENERKSYVKNTSSGRPFWLDSISFLLGCVREAERLLVITQGSGDPDNPDLGGRTNLYVRLRGHPKRHFISASRIVFEGSRPGEASGSETGPFAEFVRHVYAYATGASADDDGAGLERWIKKIQRLYRRRDEIFSGAKEVHTRLSEIDKQLESADMELGKRHKLEEERRGLKEEQQGLEKMLDWWRFELLHGEDPDDRVRRAVRRFERLATKQAK